MSEQKPMPADVCQRMINHCERLLREDILRPTVWEVEISKHPRTIAASWGRDVSAFEMGRRLAWVDGVKAKIEEWTAELQKHVATNQ